jgi:hypothetical protein
VQADSRAAVHLRHCDQLIVAPSESLESTSPLRLHLGVEKAIRADAGRFRAPLCICAIACHHTDAVASADLRETTSALCVCFRGNAAAKANRFDAQLCICGIAWGPY